MKYHNITKDDMLNGDGLRVVLWVSGCNHFCHNCQNPITWDETVGLEFDNNAMKELIEALDHDYISGLTLSGGDPMFPHNRECISKICAVIKARFPKKNIWCYTGFLYEQICNEEAMQFIDVLVDGEFIQELADVNYPWAGSTNQRVIDVKKSRKAKKVVII